MSTRAKRGARTGDSAGSIGLPAKGSARRTPQATRHGRHATPAACVRRLVGEACNQGNLAVLDEVLAPPTSTPMDGGDNLMGERLRAFLAAFRAAVPDAHWTIAEQVVQGNTVVTRLAVQGTFSGPLLGLAPPGRPATVTGVAISRFAAGRLVGVWLQADLLGLLVQLGVSPPLGLTQALTMARVERAGVLLADEPTPYAPPPRRGRTAAGATGIPQQDGHPD